MNPMKGKASVAQHGEPALNINGVVIISRLRQSQSKSRFPSINVPGMSLIELIFAVLNVNGGMCM